MTEENDLDLPDPDTEGLIKRSRVEGEEEAEYTQEEIAALVEQAAKNLDEATGA